MRKLWPNKNGYYFSPDFNIKRQVSAAHSDVNWEWFDAE